MAKSTNAATSPDLWAVYQALDKTQAIIEFELDGTVITANQNFLDALGYELDEITGQHHRMFCEPAYAASPAYAEFWKTLAAGDHQAAEFKRVRKDGGEVWLQAAYNPILDKNDRPSKVVKFGDCPAPC